VSAQGLFAYLDDVERELVELIPDLTVARWEDGRAQNARPPRVVFVPTPDGRPETFGPARQTEPIFRAAGRSVATRNVPLEVRVWGAAMKVGEETLDDAPATEVLVERVISTMRAFAVANISFQAGVWTQPTKGTRGLLYVFEAVLSLPVLERRSQLVRAAEAEVQTVQGTPGGGELVVATQTIQVPEGA
jgi:hypothetical protein